MSIPAQESAALRLHSMERLASAESSLWVEVLVDTLTKSGRLIEGGWPGTVSEARRRLMTCLAAHPQDPPPDSGELSHLVDLLYSQAKQHWHQNF